MSAVLNKDLSIQCFSQECVNIGDKKALVDIVPPGTSLQEIVESKKHFQLQKDDDNAFYVVDINRVIKLYEQWKAVLPNVTPYYAVKCNNDPVILKVLADLGTGFDCASQNEIEDVLALGVSPERIIYAHPCKIISHLKYAARCGVQKMTFDCESELLKVKEYFQDARLLVRINSDNSDDAYNLGSKFGCSVDEGIHLLDVAKQLQLKVIGVSFHVGSDRDGNGCKNPAVFQSCIQKSMILFKYAQNIGFNLSLLDIGGGFPGLTGSEDVFFKVVDGVVDALTAFSAVFRDAKIISEPGRYFASSTHTLALAVHSKKTNLDGSKVYYITDGSLSSFNVFHYFGPSPKPNILKVVDRSNKQFESVLWGPTGAPDKVCTVQIPELEIGDWIYFTDMGAYTKSLSTTFNGFPKPNIYYFKSKEHL